MSSSSRKLDLIKCRKLSQASSMGAQSDIRNSWGTLSATHQVQSTHVLQPTDRWWNWSLIWQLFLEAAWNTVTRSSLSPLRYLDFIIPDCIYVYMLSGLLPLPPPMRLINTAPKAKQWHPLKQELHCLHTPYPRNLIINMLISLEMLLGRDVYVDSRSHPPERRKIDNSTTEAVSVSRFSKLLFVPTN